jgi:hypothetical protein
MPNTFKPSKDLFARTLRKMKETKMFQINREYKGTANSESIYGRI